MSIQNTPTQTFEYQGKALPFDGLTDDRTGILASGRILRMFPAVRKAGGWIDSASLPSVGPVAIRPVTIRVPDITAEHPQTVAEIYEKRRSYHEGATRDEHLKGYPADDWMSVKEFEEARKLILKETLENFSRGSRAREAVWSKHGTKEMADTVGLLSFGEQICLIQQFKEAGMSDGQAWGDLARMKWVAVYDDPGKTRLYLYDVIDQPDPKAAEVEFLRQQAEVLIELPEKVSAAVSDLRRVLQEVQKGKGGTRAAGYPAESMPRICFVNGFREIRVPGNILEIPKARLRARALEMLYELWKSRPGVWADWESLGKKAGYTEPTAGFFRNVEDRSRPEVREVIESFVEEGNAPTKAGNVIRVRFKTGFHYEKLD